MIVHSVVRGRVLENANSSVNFAPACLSSSNTYTREDVRGCAGGALAPPKSVPVRI